MKGILGQLHRHRRDASASFAPLLHIYRFKGVVLSSASFVPAQGGRAAGRVPLFQASQHSAGANGAEMSRRFPAALPFSGVSLEKALHSVTTVHAAKTDLGLRKDVGFHAEGFMESYVRHARGRPEKCKDNSMKRTALITHQLKNESNLQSVFILGDIQGGSDGFGNACNSSQSADTI